MTAPGTILALAFVLTLPSFAKAQDDPDPVKVNEAIDKGVAWLKKEQQADGSFPVDNAYKKTGQTALCLLALLKSDVPRDDPAIVKGFDYLAKTSLWDPQKDPEVYTYAVCILIMALEAMYEDVAIDNKTVVNNIKVKGNHLEWMKRLHAWVVTRRMEYNQIKDVSTSSLLAGWGNPLKEAVKGGGQTGVDQLTKVVWGYPQPSPLLTKFDHSNTQYAVLALKSCDRCGIKTPREIWFGILNHYLTTQQAQGEEVARFGVEKDDKTTFESELKDRARGWTYTFDERNPEYSAVTGSMTAGSLGSLIIARSVMLNNGQYKKGYSDHVDRAVRDGLAWLAKHFSVTSNPGGENIWHYYYLYALERAGMLAQIRNVGPHLWYPEGAKHLLDQQDADGSWREIAGNNAQNMQPADNPVDDTWMKSEKICNTCFALLFLKRSTLIVTGTGYQLRKDEKK